MTAHFSVRRWLVVAMAMVGIAFWLTAAPASATGELTCDSVVTKGNRTSYYGCGYTPTAAKGEAAAREVLAAHQTTLGVVADADQLRLVEVKNGLASTHSRFMQVIDGIDVYMGWVSVHQGRDGTVHTIHSQYYPELTAGNRIPTIAEADAIATAAARAGVTQPRHEARSGLVWVPGAGNRATLAWEVTVFSDAPLGDFYTLVDAASGEVLLQENRIALDEGSGFSYEPQPVQQTGDVTLDDNGDATSPALDAARIPVTLQGLDAGTGLIKGEFADLSTLNSPTIPDVDANEANRVYLYDRSDERFEQVVVYSSIDRIQRYIHSLGFDDDGPDNNGIRDFPSLANAHWYTADNSFYSTGNDAVHFGNGGVDDAEDAEIVAHEYGHAIHYNQNASWGTSFQMRAMGEGWGDYLAVTVYYDDGDFDHQRDNNACVGEWDATSYSGDNPPCLRRTDGTKHYPEDLTNSSVHADGEIWSRALWDIRRYIGGHTADQVIFEHHFSVPAAADMPDAATALVQADVDVNGGANGNAIRHAFCVRGILTGTDCSGVTNNYSITSAPLSEKICAGATGEYWVNVNEIGTFTAPVTLSAVGNPAGTTVAFTPNPATPDAVVEMAVTGTGGLSAGNTSIVINAVAGAETRSDLVELNVQTAAAAPTLSAPANGAATVSTTPTFTWAGDSQSDYYVIEVATDVGFSTVVLSATTTLTTYTAGTALQTNTVYYWRVTPTNSCGEGATSGAWVFSTGSTPPTAVTLDTLNVGTATPMWLVAPLGLLLVAGALLLRRNRRA
jgi:Zn-dependent metalloprotease